MQFSSIIYITGGSVTLTKVNFTNIYTAKPVISATSGNSFTYQGGIVELINNGYEIFTVNSLYGFMQLQSFTNVILTNTTFQYNILNNINGASSNPLIFLNGVDSINLENLVFTNTFILASEIIFIDQTSLNLPINSPVIYQTITNIKIFKNKFFNNTSTSAIKISMSNFCQNINIDYNQFNKCLGSENLIQLMYTGSLTTGCIYGDYIKKTNGSNQLVYIPPSRVNITNTIFINNYYSTLLNINNLANIYLRNLTFENNGNALDPNTITIAQLKLYKDVYLSNNIQSYSIEYTNLVTLSSIYSLEFSLNNFTNNIGSLLSVISIYSLMTFNSSIFQYNTISSSADFITISTNASVDLNDLTFLNNTSIFSDNQMLSLTPANSPGNYTISNSYIYACLNGIKANSIATFSISNLTVNNSQAQVYSALYFIGPSSANLSISNSNFIENNSTIISLNSGLSGSNTILQATDLLFLRNTGNNRLITVDAKFIFSDISFINNTNFTNNSAGILLLQNLDGILYINNSYYGYNNYPQGTIAFIVGEAQVELNKCTIEYNTGTYIAYLSTNTNSSLLKTKNCILRYNQGTIIFTSTSNYKDFNSLFINNVAGPTSLIFISGMASAVLRNTSIISNTMSSNGAIVLSQESLGEIISSTFANNSVKNKGGAIFSDQNSLLIVTDSIFISNSAHQGSAIYIQHSSYLSIIQSSSFFQNSATSTGCISTLEANLLINSSILSNNTASYNSAIEILYYSEIIIENTTFSNHSGVAAHLAIDENCVGIIRNCYFNNSYSSTGCSVAKAYQGKMIIENSHVENANSLQSSSICCSLS